VFYTTPRNGVPFPQVVDEIWENDQDTVIKKYLQSNTTPLSRVMGLCPNDLEGELRARQHEQVKAALLHVFQFSPRFLLFVRLAFYFFAVFQHYYHKCSCDENSYGLDKQPSRVG
jgi:hypothetical protein